MIGLTEITVYFINVATFARHSQKQKEAAFGLTAHKNRR